MMNSKIFVSVAIALILSLTPLYAVTAAPVDSVSLNSLGLIIDLRFPEEARPTETITHNLTITAQKASTLYNFTLIINALVDSTWQQVHEEYMSTSVAENESITKQMQFTLPQKTNDKLSVYVYVLVSIFGDSATYNFYSTSVRTETYDELLNNYNELWLNNTNLHSAYQTLLQSYNSLQANYSSLGTTYNSLNQTYTTLRTQVNALTTDLNISRALTYLLIAVTVALAVLIIYLKRKKAEPYIVLRKETVALKPNEKSGDKTTVNVKTLFLGK